MQGVHASPQYRPQSLQVPAPVPGKLGGHDVSAGEPQRPRAGTERSTSSRFTRSLSSFSASLFKRAPTPGETFMARLNPRELIVFRSLMANIADAAKEDHEKPEILKDREFLDQRLGDLPARMLNVAANEFPRAIEQQAARPGSVEAAWGKLTSMAQDHLAEYARDNPGMKGISPQDKDQQRGIVSAMLNSFIRTGEMTEAGLKQLLESLPHEERQALLAEGKFFDTPVAKALIEVAQANGEAFHKDAEKLLDMSSQADGQIDITDAADTLIHAAAGYKTLQRAVETVNPDPGKPAVDQAAADKAAKLKAHMSALLSAHAGKLDTLDPKRLQKLQSALDAFGVDMRELINASVRRRLDAARAECERAVGIAIKEAGKADLAAMTKALDSACLNGSQADALQRLAGGLPVDGEGDHAAILHEVVAKAKRGLSDEDAATLAIALSGKDMATLQQTLAGAGQAGMKSGSAKERETGARMFASGALLGLLRGKPEAAPARAHETWTSDKTLTARNLNVIKDTFGVDLDFDTPHRQCTAAVNRACRAAAAGDSAALLTALHDAFASLETLQEAVRHRGGAPRSGAEQAQFLVNLITSAIQSLDGEGRLRLREELQGKKLHELEAGLRNEAAGVKGDAAAPAKAEAALKNASAAFIGELRQCASRLLNGGELLAPAP